MALAAALIAAPSMTAVAGTLYANGSVSGSIFNTPTRQHIQATFNGSGVVRPGGKRGRANGRITSVIGNRLPQPTLLGNYRVLVQAHVFHDGGSVSLSRAVTVSVQRNSLVIPGIGRIHLAQPVDLTQKGRQRFHGSGNISVPVP